MLRSVEDVVISFIFGKVLFVLESGLVFIFGSAVKNQFQILEAVRELIRL